MKVRVFIAEQLGCHADVAYECLRQLIMIAGWQTERIREEREASICYGDCMGPAVIVPSASIQAWAGLSDANPVNCGGLIVPDRCVLQGSNPPIIDPVLCAHFFMCGVYEKQPGMTDGTGIPGLGAARWGITQQAAVQHCSEQIAGLLRRALVLQTPAPAWPRGKTWALALTHDCDQPFRYRPRAFLKEAIAYIRDHRLRQAALSLMKSGYSAVRLVGQDPYWDSWQRWEDTERALGVRSAFYVATRSRFSAGSDVRDVPYAASKRALRDHVVRLHDQGWEIGLHASFNAWSDRCLLEEEVEWFEQCFRFLPQGVRSHFWSLGTGNREKALSMFAECGPFRYDSSFGLDAICGFRRGLCYPYRPYIAESGASTRLWELPPTVMDWGLQCAGKSRDDRLQAMRALIAITQQHHGVITLDWHEYTMCRGVMDGLAFHVAAELESIAADSGCWIATPGEIIAWCEEERWKQVS